MKKSSLKFIILALALAWMSALTSHAGWVKRYVYLNIDGVLVTNLFGTNLFGTVVFPGSPDLVEVLPVSPAGPFEAEFVPDSIYNLWGTWTPGYIEPPETGDYTFWVYGDDETQLWITTDGTDPLNPAKKQLIASVPVWSSIREWTKFPEQKSAPVSLEKGKRYYMEILHKDGTGGDAIGFGWQLPSGKLERPLQTFYLQPTFVGTDPIVVNGPYAAPITPAFAGDTTIYDGQEVMLFADLNLTPPYTVAWIRGAADIPGETQTYYRFRARNTDNGAQFSVRVNGTVYGPLTLSVLSDTAAPNLVSATVALSNPTQIQVVFSEEITRASATNTANYSLSSGAIQSAQIQADGRTVILKTGLLTPGVLHTLTINGIQDMALPANTILSIQTNIVVAEGAISFRFWDRIFATDLATLRTWTTGTNPPALSYSTNGFNEERTINTTSYQWNLVPARDNFMGQMIGYLIPSETGYYKFAIASDDHSILYLGTTDQRSSKREICRYDGSTGQWNTGAQLATQQSALIFLEAGKSYYIEAVHRDGTGGDGVSVFWQTPSGPPLPTANQSVQATTQPFLIPVANLATFATPPVPGALNYRIWYTSFATDLASLRIWSGNPNYANDVVTETRSIATTTYGWPLIPMMDNYAGQMIGYLTAPETGNYKFAIASDDHSILYLGTNALRSSKREICNFNGSTAQWNLGVQLANQQSAYIPLQAGQRYYIEAVYRDGTGGDGVTVCWEKPSDTLAGNLLPSANSSVAATTQPFLIPVNYLSGYSPNSFGNVTLTTDLPASFNAVENTRPALSVAAGGSPPYAYQWYKDGTAIVGATAVGYTPPYVVAADNNATFQVIVTNNFSSVTSVLATLTVTADTTKPAVTSVGSLYKQTVEVQLSEPATPATATAPANYLLFTSAGAPVAVNSATVAVNDAAHVTLQTAALPETDAMTLVVQNLVDLSAAANMMIPGTNSLRANNFDALERINNTQAYSATAVGNQIFMTAGGGDIWDAGDRCAYLYKTVTGNFDYKIQGISLQTINQWCKMGLMARPSTVAGARNTFVAFTPLAPSQNTYTPQIRDLTGGASTSSDVVGTYLNAGLQGGVVARPTIVYPSWVRLQRIGSTFYYYYGTTGTNWTFWTYYDSAASAEGALPATIQLGLALTSHDTARTADGVMASFTAVNDGPLYLTLQPTNATVVEGGTVSFTAGAAGSTPILYQWLKNTTPIPDATNTTLVLTRVPFGDNGALIACRASNPYGQVLTTTNALLTVTQDGTLPTVRFYATPKVNLTPTEVKLIYSEWVDPVTAQNTANYQITTSPGGIVLAISSAALQVDERTVILTTDPQTPGTLYKVVVNNVKDLACCPANTIALNSTDYFFYSGTAPRFAQRADGYIIMEAENAQENIIAADGDEFGFTNSFAGYSGTGAMRVPNGRGTGGTAGTGTQLYGTGAALVFHVNFTLTGRNIIWIRGWNETTAGNDDSIFVGYNNDVGIADPTSDFAVGMNTDINQSQLTGYPNTGWQWRSDRSAGTDPMTFTNTTTGLHRFIIWQREDGTHVDKIVIEPGNRAAGNTAAPAPATANNNAGEAETWDYIVAPPSPPTISISSPANGQSFPLGNIPVTATPSGPSPIVLVEFFQGTNLIGTATASPYTINWAGAPEGIYSLTARVTDAIGYQATSAAVKIIVGDVFTLVDVTTPGDPISLVAGSSPAAETVTNMINNTTAKCLNYDALDTAAPFVGPVGFVVTPSKGASIVSKLRFYTANDTEARDPVHYVLDGSNDGSSWSLISSNLLTLPSGRNAVGLALDPLTQNVWHVAFANTTAYTSYRLRFFNLKDNASANSMQLAEVELLGTIVAPITLSIGTGTGGSLTLTASQPGTLLSATNLTAPVIWADEGPVSGTVIITPASNVPAKYYRLRVP